MRISRLIQELTAIRELVGDREVEVRNPAGDFDSLGSVRSAYQWKAVLLDTEDPEP